MRGKVIIFGLVVALAGAGAPRAPAEEKAPSVVPAVWVEREGEAETLVVALFSAAAEPSTFHAGFGFAADREAPGYGSIDPGSWREISVGPGEAVLARLPVSGRGPVSVLLADRPSKEPLDVHELIHGELPPGAFHFDRPRAGGAVAVDRHLVPVGGKVRMTLAAPSDEAFFREETLEIARVATRMGIASDDPDGPRGFARVTWLAPEDDPPATRLVGEEGERRIRAHFTKPDCAWANRHVGWMDDLLILEYGTPAELAFSLDTSEVKTAGRISGHWKGYGAVAIESIWPNGFGGSSTNFDLPDVLVVPRGTAVRETRLD